MQAEDWDIFFSVTLTDILIFSLNSLPDSDSIRFRLGLSVRSLIVVTILCTLSQWQ